MNSTILSHYLSTSMYTDLGLYKDLLLIQFPSDIREIGLLIRKNVIHRSSLDAGNTGSNSDLKYGDMTIVPWWRQAEDDILVTAVAMIAELYRRDERGLTLERTADNKIVVTCRFVAVLTAAILKAQGIPARVRSGFAAYFDTDGKSWDHWITEYWQESESRWVAIDVDGSLHETGFDLYDVPEKTFAYAADAWLSVRNGSTAPDYYWNAMPHTGLVVLAWELFYDFHCLMNNEISYLHHPKLATLAEFEKHTVEQLTELDSLATLMQRSDDNFDQLQQIWNTKKEFRLLSGGLL